MYFIDTIMYQGRAEWAASKGTKAMLTKTCIETLTIAVFMLIPLCGSSQQIHPKKQAFKNVAKWPTTSPSKVVLRNFRPFRAVYDRTYRQHSGTEAGAVREDRVIISAEQVGWDGKKAISISLIDSGIEGKSDTNARALFMIVDRKNLNVLFEVGPIPGKAKDYYFARIENGTASISEVTTDTQKINAKTAKQDKPGFGPSAWAMASSGLRKGKKIKLSPVYSPQANPLTEIYAGHVLDKTKFTDGNGNEHEVFVLETTKSFTNSKVKHLYLSNKPPYYFGTETVDLDTGERKRFVWLRDFEMMNQSPNAESSSSGRSKN